MFEVYIILFFVIWSILCIISDYIEKAIQAGKLMRIAKKHKHNNLHVQNIIEHIDCQGGQGGENNGFKRS